jgi:hypothetical protein
MKILNQTTGRKNTQRIEALIVLLLSFSFTSFGQTLVTQLSLNDANLNASETQRYSSLQQDTFTQDLKLINFGNPLDFVNAAGTIQFEIPDVQGIIEAEAIDITQTDTSYSWTGKLLSHAGYFGYYEIQGHRAACLQIDERFFEIMPVKAGVNTLREIRRDVLDSGVCTTSAEGQTNSEADLCQNDYNTCAATIDILVLLPPDATDWLQTRFGNDWFSKALYIGIGTQALNWAFINSDIPNKKANIILENFDMTYPDGTNCLNLLNALQTQAASRRDAVHADLVVLITAKRDFNCGSGAACAEISNNPPYNCDPGYAFSEIWWLFHPRWSMLHEVGHLMGGGHDRPYDNDNNCAHGWTVGGNRFQRILHYSNPDVVYNGDATGTASDNNAKVIRNGACIVANYRQNISFDARIDTDPWVCRSWGEIYLYADVQQPSSGNPGIPPYSYEWRWNFSGNFTSSSSTYIGNTPFASFQIPATGSYVWVQMKVTSSDGLTITKLRKIEIFDEDHPKCMWRSQGKTQQALKPANNISIVPNPANAEVHIRCNAETGEKIEIALYDALARLAKSNHFIQSPGENSLYLPVGDLPNGIYSLVFRSANGVLTQKLIINR